MPQPEPTVYWRSDCFLCKCQLLVHRIHDPYTIEFLSIEMFVICAVCGVTINDVRSTGKDAESVFWAQYLGMYLAA
jgi:hypothetical protein